MNVETRVDCEQATALMAAVLRNGESVEAEYPLVFGGEAQGRVVVVEEDGEVRSTCAILCRTLVTPKATFKVGMIGSVSTDPEYRGRGLATQLLEKAEEELRLEGCLFSLLWADSEEFYLKRGYQRMGSEVDFVVGAAQLKKLPPADNVRLLEEDDLDQVHGLYARHAEHVERTLHETRAMLDSPGMEVLVHSESDQVTAYACLGRGGDMANVVHEWGGSPEAVAACVHAHLKRRALQGAGSEIYVISPASAVEFHKYFAKLGCASVEGVLGMGKLLDLDKLVELYSWFLGPDGRVRVDQRPAKMSPDGMAGLRVQGPNMALLLSADDAFRALLGPSNDRTDLDYLERALGLRLEALPLTPFVWGLDSI